MCVCGYVYVCVCMCVGMYVYIYIYTCIHTYNMYRYYKILHIHPRKKQIHRQHNKSNYPIQSVSPLTRNIDHIISNKKHGVIMTDPLGKIGCAWALPNPLNLRKSRAIAPPGLFTSPGLFLAAKYGGFHHHGGTPRMNG